MSSFYLGIDLGTSGCRIIAINELEQIVGQSSINLPRSTNKNGHITQKPHDWWLACFLCMDNILSQINREQIKAIAIDGTSGSVLLCDQDGTLVSDAYMYNDKNNEVAAKQIEPVAPKESAVHGTSSGLAKCISLIDAYKPGKTVKCLNQADWIAGNFTQQFNFSDQNNSLKLGYDVINQQWPKWLEELGCTSHLVEHVYQPGKVYTNISPNIAKTFGLPKNTKIVAGTTDSIAAFIATKSSNIGDAVTSLGSTLAIKLISDKPIFSPEYGIYSHRLGNIWLVGGASNTGGSVINKYFDQSKIDELTKKLDPKNVTDLNYYPLPEPGERFPVNDNNLQPKLEPRPNNDLDFFQGILEGITHIEKSAYQKLVELGACQPTQIKTMGGGSSNSAWQQMRQTAINVPILKATITEAAYGSALLAKQGIQQ